MEIQTENGLKGVLKLMEAGEPVQAQQILSALIEKELDCKELLYTNRSCFFWIDSINRMKEISDPYYKGSMFLSEWKTFNEFMTREKYIYEPAVYAAQRGFFSTALKHYQSLFETKDSVQKADVYRKAGICYKKLGEFDNAKLCMMEASKNLPNNAAILAELADCYSLCGEERKSKVLFREAFFVNAEGIDIDFLDSGLIRCLIEKTEEKGHKGKYLPFWIPVYGTLGGVFNIKRELSSQEVARLIQSIYAMEMENKDPSSNSEILTPKLLNSYFWLIDHYVMMHENQSRINEVLLKIKILDSSVYESYIN